MDATESRYLRQTDLFDPAKAEHGVTVIGAGAIGSAAVINLSKMGVNINAVYDDDTIEEHNISNQMLPVSLHLVGGDEMTAVGTHKVSALNSLCLELTGRVFPEVREKYTDQKLRGIVVCATDSMESRIAIWPQVKGKIPVPLYIDARMGAQVLRILLVRNFNDADYAEYEKTLCDPADAEQLPCSARSIIYCPSIAGAMIAYLAKEYLTTRTITSREILMDIPAMFLTTIPATTPTGATL